MAEVNEKQVKDIISGARNDIRDIEGYVLGQLKNQVMSLSYILCKLLRKQIKNYCKITT
ncbi:MAG TPA: hypothetical protein LFW21_02880 [Rickettsia endosymbiont of Pyrocoelia pectoralis]|nr:hypothetical protein [Rickettsia endosymbiont of Pyrocoelia pectoralis]